jgi:HlyD family type I secretion membrane fusion protein
MTTKPELPVAEHPVRDWRRPALVGYVIIIFAFGIFGGWAALAKLDSAVVAPGTVTVESNRKTIAHLEGGIVQQILVREGQHVARGQVLFRMDDTQPQASADMTHNQLMAALGQEARLIAERDGKSAVTFPPQMFAATAGPVAAEVVADQSKQFDERRASLSNQISIFEKKIVQYNSELEGLASEKDATERQLKFIEEELRDLRGLLEKQLVPKARVMSLEREKGRLEGLIGRSMAETSKAHNGVSEARLQIDQLRKKYLEDVNQSLLDVRQKISDLRERARVSADILRRVEIHAPRAGVVQNVRASTVGGIVKPGEPLLELIPDGDELIVSGQISPSDIDVVAPGSEAEVRFAAFHGKVLPVVMGRILSLSRDRLTDEVTRQPFFLARVAVDREQLPADVRDKITAGMPAEVIIPTGERSMADYLLRPLSNKMRKALREQ